MRDVRIKPSTAGVREAFDLRRGGPYRIDVAAVADVRRVEVDDDPPQGVVRWLISCDESGIGGLPYYGFGTLWMGWQRRGEFSGLIKRLRAEHGYEHEIKWNKIDADNLFFYKALVEEFFKSSYMRSEEHTSELQSLAYLVCRL